MTEPRQPQPDGSTRGILVALGLLGLALLVFAVLVLTSGVLAS